MKEYIEPLNDRLKLTPNDTNIYPVAYCPNCKEISPFNTVTLIDVDKIKKYLYCLNCHYSPKELLTINGYVSDIDLEESGWSTEL